MSNPKHLYAIKRPDGVLILTTDDDKEATWRRASVIDRVLADLAWSGGVGAKFSHKAERLGYRCVEVEIVEVAAADERDKELDERIKVAVAWSQKWAMHEVAFERAREAAGRSYIDGSPKDTATLRAYFNPAKEG